MFRDKLKKISDSIDSNNTNGQKDKKKIENLVFLIVLLIITIIAINYVLDGNKTVNKQDNNTNTKKLANIDNQELQKIEEKKNNSNLEEQLESILTKIRGVGDVKVFINYSESSEIVAMYNENTKTSNTEENDTSGGSRKIQETDLQKDIIYQEQNGEKTPITQKIIQPKVEGAIITAKGATNVETKANIIQAVEAVTGLATHKIQVFEMN